VAKAPAWNVPDGEARRLGERSGLETPVRGPNPLIKDEKSEKLPTRESPSSKRCPLAVAHFLGVRGGGA